MAKVQGWKQHLLYKAKSGGAAGLVLLAKHYWRLMHDQDEWSAIGQIHIGDPRRNDRLIWPVDKR